ncbi:MAG TPA: NAD(P)-dependent oxidoreductase [Candidatus Elarobacter sp.]|nr:NAD(P)-dependent oxidoreductase [Candidatus Elarobacter sp.]
MPRLEKPIIRGGDQPPPVVLRDREHVVAHTQGLWDALRGERVFVTGGTGFVGTALVEAFVAANAAHALGARIVVLTRDAARFAVRAPHLANDPAVELVAGDAVDFAPPRGRFACVVHAATERYHDADAARPLAVFERDLAATRRALELAREAGATRFLFTSSGAVYGRQPPDLANVPEDYPGAPGTTDPRTEYGQSKRASEFACASYARVFGVGAVIARLFTFVGPHLPLDEGYAVGNFLRDVLAGGTIRIAGDGTTVRSYLYAADLAIWLWTMLLEGTPGRVYNAGSPQPVTIRELAADVAAAVAPTARIEVAREAVPGAPAARYVPCTRRAEDELGLRVRVPLHDALVRTYEFLELARPAKTS